MKVLLIDWFNIVKRRLYVKDIETTDIGDLVDVMSTDIINIFYRLYTELRPDLIVICSDSGSNVRARNIVEEYKANRKKGKTLSEQQKENSYMEIIKNVASKFPCPFIDVKNTEADMIIRCVVNHIHNVNDKIEIVIASSDSDFIQLLSKKVTIYDWDKGIVNKDNWYKIHKISDDYFDSRNYAIAKSIVGDNSDNIDGVNGWGWKKVFRLFSLINRYYETNIVYDNITNLKNCIIEVANNHEAKNFDDKDIRFMNKAAEMIKNNYDLILRNMTVIDLSIAETPHLYKIYDSIKNAFSNKISYSHKDLIKEMRLDRFGKLGEDYDKIIQKNSKALFAFYSIANKANLCVGSLAKS